LKKVCYKVSLCEKCQRQRCKAFIGRTICAKMIGGGRSLQTDRFGVKSLIFTLFSFLAPQPSEKSSIKTNRKSTMRFPMSQRYVVPKLPPKGVLENAKRPKFG